MMLPTPLSASLARVCRPVAPQPTDGALVAAFVASRDEAAFAELVRRHGPMVLAVCQRITGHSQDAEDALQATFLVLARRAAVVRPAEQVANWLYGVAVRTAQEARASAARRRAREAPTHPLPEVGRVDEVPFPTDFRTVLDEELVRLPDKYRAVLVACDLGGEPQTAAARRFSLPVGTVSTRLTKAREILAERLKNRGITLSLAGLTVAFGQVGSAAVPPCLCSQAVVAVFAPGGPPAHVAALSNGVLHLMFAHKLKTISLAVAIIATAVIGGWLFASGQPPTPDTNAKLSVVVDEKPKPALPTTRPADPKPLPKAPNKVLFYWKHHLTLIDPDGKNDTTVSEKHGVFHPGPSRLSPDGTRVAVLIPSDAPAAGGDGRQPRKLIVRWVDGREPGKDLGIECQEFCWSPDGTKIAWSDFVDRPGGKPPEATDGIVDAKTGVKSPLNLPSNHFITDWARDGDHLLTTVVELAASPPVARLFLMNLDGTEHKALTPPEQLAVLGRISPDGKRVLYFALTLPEKDKPGRPKHTLTVLDTVAKTSTPVADLPLNGDVQGFCWSPDGKKIAYSWREVHQGKPEDIGNKPTDSTLVVCDPDGKNQKSIAIDTGMGAWLSTIADLDWR